MAGYIRVDTSNNIADGNVISAADLDNEFDGVQAGFNASTGHTHGGAAGEGAPITKLGPAQDVTISTSLMAPKTTNTVDLGSSSLRYKDLFLAGNATIAGTTTLSAALTYGGVTLSNAVTGTGNMVLSASPTLTGTLSGANASLSGTLGVTGVATLGAGAILNTPASVTLTNATGLPISTGVSGLGTGVATALAVNVGSAGAPVLFNGALGTPSSGTVTNLTGTASININGTVGATTANTGAFTTLSASSTVSGTGFSTYLASPPSIGGTAPAAGAFTTLSATGVTTVQAGTVSAPAITTSGDTNTGIFFPAADTIAFAEGGVEAMRLDSSGNMGVGTSSPAAPLQLGDGTQATREIRTSTLSGSGQGGFLRGYRAGNPSFYVGDSAPISGGSAGGMTLFSYGATSVDTYTNGVLRSTLDSSGNLGLGVTPSAWQSGVPAFESTLGIYSGRTESNLTSNAYFNSGWKYIATGLATQYQQQSGQHRWFNAASGTAGNAISFTQAMTLNAAGDLLVGTTSANGRITSYSTSDWNLGCVRTGTTTNGHIQFINGNGSVGSITTSGSSTTYVTSSDYRLKENIQPMTGALAKVSTLKPCTYKWKVDGSDGEGFIAHELQAVCPDAVTGEKDATRMEQYEISPAVPATFDEEGNELTSAVEAVMGEREVPSYQGIDTSFLVATLTAAIQELKAIVDAQGAEIAALKAKA